MPPRRGAECEPRAAVPTGPCANVRSCRRSPSSAPRLDSALAARDLARVRAAARELPTIVTLADAVQVLLLMEEVEDPTFDAAAVRWIARLTTECQGLTLGSVQAAVEALDAL